MKRPSPALDDLAALLALFALAVGTALVQGPGWGLIVAGTLVLLYLVLPDQIPGGPR